LNIKYFLRFIILTGLIAGFFTIPDKIYQDYFSDGESYEINNYEHLVFAEMRKMEVTEQWLQTSESIGEYHVEYTTLDNVEILIRTAADDRKQIIDFSYSYNEDDRRIKNLSYDISENTNNVKKSFYVSMYPSSNYVNAKIATVDANYRVDYSEAAYFEKLIGKWKHILTGEKLIKKELDLIANRLKDYMENSHGRLLNIE